MAGTAGIHPSLGLPDSMLVAARLRTHADKGLSLLTNWDPIDWDTVCYGPFVHTAPLFEDRPVRPPNLTEANIENARRNGRKA